MTPHQEWTIQTLPAVLREQVRQELLLRRVLPQTAEPEPPAPVATLFWDQDEEEERDRDRDNPGGCFGGYAPEPDTGTIGLFPTLGAGRPTRRIVERPGATP